MNLLNILGQCIKSMALISMRPYSFDPHIICYIFYFSLKRGCKCLWMLLNVILSGIVCTFWFLAIHAACLNDLGLLGRIVIWIKTTLCHQKKYHRVQLLFPLNNTFHSIPLFFCRNFIYFSSIFSDLILPFWTIVALQLKNMLRRKNNLLQK